MAKIKRYIYCTMIIDIEVNEENYPGLTPKQALAWERALGPSLIQSALIDEIANRDFKDCAIVTQVRLEE